MADNKEKLELDDQQLTKINGGKQKKRATYEIEVCVDVGCYIKGASNVYDKLTQLLGISNGQVSSDGKFCLDSSRCFGCCGIAPAIRINGEVFGNVTIENVAKIIEDNCI
ncbi:MAG: NAD(P)H-dependent oxidoreductase subunit E [Erysipelotrichaceae bacterium]|nr:NAD(P)H-dependent oxidoreductase subunit E [Erysipelotrichaceae bacterium]